MSGCSVAEGKTGREAPFPLLLLAALPLPPPLPPGLSNLGMGPGIACDCLFPASSAGRLLLLFLPPTPYIWNELHRVSAVEWSLRGMVDLRIRPAPLNTTRSPLPGEQLAGRAQRGGAEGTLGLLWVGLEKPSPLVGFLLPELVLQRQ